MTATLTDPIWIKQARKYIGLTEVPGKKHNPTIIGWWEKLKVAIRDDETPWCGAFVGGVLNESGALAQAYLRDVKNPAGARNYLQMTTKLDRPALGAIVVFWRGSRNGWSGHVGFIVGQDTHGNLMVLGGNQGDAVNIKPFAKDRVLGYRWPGPGPLPARYDLPILTSDGRVSTNEA